MTKTLPNIPNSKIRYCQECPYLRFWQHGAELKVACQLKYFELGLDKLSLSDNVLVRNIPKWCPLEDYNVFAALADSF